MRGMRVLCVTNGPFLGGDGRLRVNRHTGRFLVELAGEVDELTVAQGRVDSWETGTLSDFDLALHPQVRVSWTRWDVSSRQGRAFSYPRALLWILREVARADVLYVFLPGHLPLLFTWAARLLRRPYGVYLRGALHLESRRMEGALAGARFVLATTALLADRARPVCADSEVVTPMVEVRLGDVVAEPTIREPGMPPNILFVGRIEAAKGIPELLEGLGALRADGVDFTLSLAGSGPQLEAYRQDAASRGLGDAVFHGMVSDPSALAELFRSADLLVLPTHVEGFPRVLYEAMTYGVPVVTTFVGGIPSVMRDGENCLEIPVKDPSGLAEVVRHALADPALRHGLVAGGIATMRGVLDPGRPTHARQVLARLSP
jgi:glycosyltransferase involved in cell wall biosynthesis